MLKSGEDLLLHSELEQAQEHEGMSGHGSHSDPLQQQQDIARGIAEQIGDDFRPLLDEDDLGSGEFDDTDPGFAEGQLPPANPRTSEVQEQLEVLDALQQVALPFDQPLLFRDKSKQRLYELKKKQKEEAERRQEEQERIRKEKEVEHLARLRRIEVATRRLRRMQLKRAARLQKEQERAALKEKQKQQEAIRPRPPKSRRPEKGSDSAPDRRKKVSSEETRKEADEKHKQAMEAERQATLAREAARKRILERLHTGAVAAAASEGGALSIEGLRVAEKEGSRLDYQKQAQERLRQQARRKREEEAKRKEEVQSQSKILQERKEQAQQEVANVLDMAKRRAAEHLQNKHKDEEQQRIQQEASKRALREARQRYWKPAAVAEVKLKAPPMPTKEEVQRRAMVKRKHQQLELKRWMRVNGSEPTAEHGEASGSTCLPEEATVDLSEGEVALRSQLSQLSSGDEAVQEDGVSALEQSNSLQDQAVGPDPVLEEAGPILPWPHDDRLDADLGGKVVDVEEENDTEVSVAQAMAEAIVEGASGNVADDADNDEDGGHQEDGSSVAADVGIPEEPPAAQEAGEEQQAADD